MNFLAKGKALVRGISLGTSFQRKEIN